MRGTIRLTKIAQFRGTEVGYTTAAVWKLLGLLLECLSLVVVVVPERVRAMLVVAAAGCLCCCCCL